MTTKILLAGIVALIMGGVVIAPQLVSAFRGEPGVPGPDHSPERHQVMTQAFKDNDYQAWADQMQGRGRVSEVINEENFERFAEAHRLASEGDEEGATRIRAELGLGQANGAGKNSVRGQRSNQRIR